MGADKPLLDIGGQTLLRRAVDFWRSCGIADSVIVASGGAGTMEHFAEAAEAGADVLLAASVFHFHVIGIPELKAFLASRGLSVRT